jgi:hypothetical protein
MLLKTLNLSLIGRKTLWEKEKMLVTSVFSFSDNVFKRRIHWGLQKSLLWGKGLTLSLLTTTQEAFVNSVGQRSDCTEHEV